MSRISLTVEDLVSIKMPAETETTGDKNERQLLSIEKDIFDAAKKLFEEQELSDCDKNDLMDL